MTQPRYAPRPEEPLIVIDAPSERARSSGQSPLHPGVAKALDGVLTVQRPLVLAHLRRVRAKHPHASPQQLTELLEKHYLNAVMAGGAGVGAAAAVPAVGTGVALALAGAETLGFIEATALFAHAVAEVHGITLVDRDRTHALILALMLGDEGAALLRQVTAQVGGGLVRNAFWSEVITTSLPRNLVRPALEQLQSAFFKKLAKTGTASVVGKAIPYGVGAVIGGTGNRIMGGKVVKSARTAFGPAPVHYPPHLAELMARPEREPRAVRAQREPREKGQALARGKQAAGALAAAVGSAASKTAGAVGSAASHTAGAVSSAASKTAGALGTAGSQVAKSAAESAGKLAPGKRRSAGKTPAVDQPPAAAAPDDEHPA